MLSPRRFEAATCSLARTQRLFGMTLAVHNRRVKQNHPCPYIGLRIPLVPRGFRTALIRHMSSHDEMSRVVILCLKGQARNIDVVIRALCRDMNDSRQKDHEIVIFFFVRNGPNSWADQTQAHSNSSTNIPVYELPARPRRQLLTMAHIHRVVPPRSRSETSWLRAWRVWACTRPLESLCATAGLVAAVVWGVWCVTLL